MKFGFGWKRHAGLICLYSTKGCWALQFGVKWKHWQIGWRSDWYDGLIYTFGLGPLFLWSWAEIAGEDYRKSKTC